jgi:hypothetical protein
MLMWSPTTLVNKVPFVLKHRIPVSPPLSPQPATFLSRDWIDVRVVPIAEAASRVVGDRSALSVII